MASDASGDGEYDYNWVSGRATAITVDPADPTANTIYLGGAYGGVWKSTNAGPLSQSPASVTWTALTDTQPTLAIGAIAIQPGNSDPNKSLILAGTGEGDSSADSYYGLGILRSANAGNTWTLISTDTSGTRPFAGMAFSKIAFSTGNPKLAAAATAGASEGIIEGLENPLTANLGIYYSTDSGADWTYATIADGSTTVAAGSVSSVAYNGAAGEFFAAVRYHGFYVSSDGINWKRLTNQPGSGLTTSNCPPNPSSTSCPIYRGEITVVPGRNEMYVWYVDGNDNDQGIWASTNGGSSWSQLDEAGITLCGDNFGCGTEQGGYNLELAAVPNNTATDLYAGAINLYKCTISSVVPNCGGSGSNTFLNLTHAYGCPPDFGSIAHVHPAQHALAYLLINKSTQDVMYFANDGGIYRALDGFTGLTAGNCGGSNSFDSLNQTLGSMTQFIAFSESANDPNVILGGTQGNGSPGAASVLLSSTWQNVNFGDGGYNQIDPTNENNWFVSNPPDAVSGVNIFNCASGIDCHTQDFQNNQVVSSATLGGDTGPYNVPYILDPQSSGEMIVGTCRLWRGPAAGGAYTVLSHSFETGGDGICSGDEINLVRSLAAGGALDNNGFCNLMYAGTDGYGPLIPTSPPGGHVWVSTNVAGGPSTWVDQTGSINPDNFPVSSVSIDTSDKSGLTAYVGIMGFHVSHVWQTSNGGASWTDFTANLPDAPVNAVLVDPGTTPTNGTLYAGTDVGVFSTSTAGANWTEVGTQGGYVPNVAITSLGIFNTITTKLLRASTYGRGVWQFPLITTPDYVLSVSPNTLTVFGGQPGVLNGKAISLFGYNSSVVLSCTNGATPPPPNCQINPGSVIPTSQGAAFTITASSGTDQDYNFNLHGVGGDQGQLTHDFPLTLRVVDFALTPPSPSSISVNIPNTSGPVRFQVTATGSFNATVNLSCLGLPDGAACNFSPSSSVNPTAGHPVSMTLTVTTSTGTPTGTFPIILNGATEGGPNEQQNLSLTITDYQDFALTASCVKSAQCGCPSPTSATASVTGLCVFNGTLTAQNGYDSLVTLSCASGAPPTCSASPPSLTPTANGAPFALTLKSGNAQAYDFNIAAKGSDPSDTSHTLAVQFTTAFDFQIANTSGVQSVAAGQSATYDLELTPMGTSFPHPVSLSCSGLPGLSTCSFSPSEVIAGSGATPVTFAVATTAPVLASLDRKTLALLGSFLLPLFAPLWPALRRRLLSGIITFAILGLLVSCGGGGSSSSVGAGQPGTNPGTYTVTVQAVCGSLVRTTPVTLTVN